MHVLKSIDEVAYQALQEDLGSGDLTASLIPENRHSTAKLITRENAILCGTRWFNSVFRQLDKNIAIRWKA
ncbi:MAG: nicotinate-nucleotide diphosphorylase (carboxylating), partial [Gammaproteobacteria bacterium]|nr:nicotinate-nucleotide diphosphorylase (carboxylating) [Gammaproteobacteria bacterium]